MRCATLLNSLFSLLLASLLAAPAGQTIIYRFDEFMSLFMKVYVREEEGKGEHCNLMLQQCCGLHGEARQVVKARRNR